MTLKTFLRLFIALSVTMTGRSQNQTACVTIQKNDNFPFKFIPEIESLKRNRTAWENATLKILNYTNYCLEKCFGNCEKPVIMFTFPLISGNPTIPLKVLPRPYLATKEASSGTARQVLSALGQIWKLFVFCLMAAAISGIMIWFLDHKANYGHFPKSFWSGTREGLWWAIVTMTTVGYGDKTPKSFLGRVYASLWMIIGMLLMSSFTAQISSTITTDDLRPLDDKFGYNIGVPNGSKEFFEERCEGAILKEYSTEEQLFRSLEDGEVDKIWLFDCKENTENPFKIVDVLVPPAPVIGAKVKLLGEKKRRKVKENFYQCLKSWTEEVEDDESILEQEKQRRCIEKHRRGRYRSDERTQSQMGFIDILLCTAAGLLIILFTTGALWDSCFKLRHARKPLDNADIEKAVGAQELQSTASILN